MKFAPLNVLPGVKVAIPSFGDTREDILKATETCQGLNFSSYAGWEDWDLRFLENSARPLLSLYIDADKGDRVMLPATGLERLKEYTSFFPTLVGPHPSLPELRNFAGSWGDAHFHFLLREVQALDELFVESFAGESLEVLGEECGGSIRKLVVEGRRLKALFCGPSVVFSSLAELDCRQLSQLVRIGAIAAACPRLETIALDGARKMSTVDELADLEQLKVIDLENCGKIESLLPLERSRFEKIWLVGTRVNDGKLRWLGEKLGPHAKARHYDL